MTILAMLAVGILVLAVAAGISWLVLEAVMFALRRGLADAQNDGEQLAIQTAGVTEEMAAEFSF